MPMPWSRSPAAIALGALWALVAAAWIFTLAQAPGWVGLAFAVLVSAGATAGTAAAWARAAERRRRRVMSSRGRRRLHREAAAAHERLFRGVIDGVDAPVFATDGSGVVTVCNSAASDLLVSGGGRVVGRTLDELVSHADLLTMHEAAMNGRSQFRRLRMVGDGSVRVFDVTAAALPRDPSLPAGRHEVVLTFRDVTELAQAMQLKTDFVANASHELRTPLAAIRGAVETLAEVGDTSSAIRQRLTEMIAQNSMRLEDLLNDLMDLSRLESPETAVKIHHFDLGELAQGLRGVFESVLGERRLELDFDIAEGARFLETDRHLIELALKNLVDNACKFAREGTVVRVRVSLQEPTGPGRAHGARFEVTDQGIGIPLQHQQRIFERFYQVDPSRSGDPRRRGTGLGLAIVKHAVRLLGGSVGVRSVWQQGTTVWFEVPGCAASPPPAAEPGADRRQVV
ncbi:MAG: PAS domain-containing protein [Phycisphaeraceae bacterium]|nr:PAS domain-containing protein [Phycisphaeraceae bacterium]MCW5753985.1 PAS domain-containing protein [Phycisphaeraceae bacterium]